MPAGGGYGPVSGSARQTVQLTTIPRKSSVTCADGNIGSSTIININRASDSFRHTLKYSFGSLSGTIVEKTASTSYGWTIPTSFYKQIPDSDKGKGTITCETYSGDSLIGTSTCSFNAFVIETDNKPSLSAVVQDINSATLALTGDANKIVKYYSNAQVVTTATAKNSATIKSITVSCAGQSKTGSNVTITGAESNVFTITARDSRGFENNIPITKTLVNYVKCAITSISVTRESTTSNTVNAVVRGNFFNGGFGKSTNALTLKWRYRIKDGTWGAYTTVTATKSGNTFSFSGTLGTDFDFQQAYEFQVVASDLLVTSTKNIPVTRGIPLIDLGKDDVKVTGEVEVDGNMSAKNVHANNLSTAGTPNSSSFDNVGSTGELNKSGLYSVNISDIWYNLINLRHRNGDADGTSYGMQIRNQLTSSNSKMQVRQQNAGTWGDWRIIAEAGLALYDNSTGTTGTVTLSSSSANFIYLEIYYKNADGQYGSVRVNAPNGKTTYGTIIRKTSGDTAVLINSALFAISGTTITPSRNSQANIYFSGSSNSDTNTLSIVKVLGYR